MTTKVLLMVMTSMQEGGAGHDDDSDGNDDNGDGGVHSGSDGGDDGVMVSIHLPFVASFVAELLPLHEGPGGVTRDCLPGNPNQYPPPIPKSEIANPQPQTP